MYRMVSNSLTEVNDFVKNDSSKDNEFIDIFPLPKYCNPGNQHKYVFINSLLDLFDL